MVVVDGWHVQRRSSTVKSLSLGSREASSGAIESVRPFPNTCVINLRAQDDAVDEFLHCKWCFPKTTDEQPHFYMLFHTGTFCMQTPEQSLPLLTSQIYNRETVALGQNSDQRLRALRTDAVACAFEQRQRNMVIDMQTVVHANARAWFQRSCVMLKTTVEIELFESTRYSVRQLVQAGSAELATCRNNKRMRVRRCEVGCRANAKSKCDCAPFAA